MGDVGDVVNGWFSLGMGMGVGAPYLDFEMWAFAERSLSLGD